MLYREGIIIYCENYAEIVNIFCEQNGGLSKPSDREVQLNNT